MSWAEIKKAVNSNLDVPLNEYSLDVSRAISSQVSYPFNASQENREIFSIQSKCLIYAVAFVLVGNGGTNASVSRQYKILVDDEIWDNQKVSSLQPRNTNGSCGYGFATLDVINSGKDVYNMTDSLGRTSYEYPLCRQETPRVRTNTMALISGGNGVVNALLKPIVCNNSFKYIGVKDTLDVTASVSLNGSYLYVLYSLLE